MNRSSCCTRDCQAAIDRSRRLFRAFRAENISADEFHYNIAIALVSACDKCMGVLMDELPDQLVAGSAEYLGRFLKPVDFMPCPRPLLLPGATEKEVEEAKHRLRPKFLQLYHLANRKPLC